MSEINLAITIKILKKAAAEAKKKKKKKKITAVEN